MNAIKRILFIALAMLVLNGCCPAPLKPDTIIKYELVKPSPNMLVLCPVTPPPATDTYAMASAADKEKYLFNLASDLYSNLTLCNSHWATLNQWYVDQSKIYQAK